MAQTQNRGAAKAAPLSRFQVTGAYVRLGSETMWPFNEWTMAATPKQAIAQVQYRIAKLHGMRTIQLRDVQVDSSRKG